MSSFPRIRLRRQRVLLWGFASLGVLAGCGDVLGQPILTAPLKGTGGTAGADAGGRNDAGGFVGGEAGNGLGGESGAVGEGGTTDSSGGTSSGGVSSGGASGGATSVGTGGSTTPPKCPDALVGFAAVGPPVMGGKGGKVVTATTAAQLKEYATQEEPLLIRINGTIELTEQIRPLPF